MKLRCATLLGLFLAAAGCGQKGPLYLPGDPNEGRIVLPDELAGAEQGERVEEPGQAPENADEQGQAPESDAPGDAPGANEPAQDDARGPDPRAEDPQEEDDDPNDGP